MSLTDRPLRADAERNRKRILAAAAELFAERGLDVAIDEIAAKAEVGIGTVYRRFPDREALVDALFEDKIHEIEAIALEALRVSDPWDAFERFMRGVCTLHARDRGLKEAMLSDHRGAERACRARETIAPLGAMLLSRAQAAGAVREDLVAADVPLMHFAVGYIAEKTRDASPDAWERLLMILLDGLKAQRTAVTPLEAQPVALEDIPKTLGKSRG
jgi:AcrR family transcriptional regulator